MDTDDGARGGFIDAVGGFELGVATGEGDGGVHVFGAEFVEHDEVGAGFQCLLQVFQVFHARFDGLVGGNAVGGCDVGEVCVEQIG